MRTPLACVGSTVLTTAPPSVYVFKIEKTGQLIRTTFKHVKDEGAMLEIGGNHKKILSIRGNSTPLHQQLYNVR